jgi:hypothetical protein
MAIHCDLNSSDGAECLLRITELHLLIASNQQKENIIKKMPLPPPKNRTAYETYHYRGEPGVLETFMRDYRQILTFQFQKI